MVSDYKEKWGLTYIFKPLTMLLIMGLLIGYGDLSNIYSQWILAGLSISMVGDVFLMLRPQKFIAGLVSFLVAHVLYVIAFYLGVRGNQISWYAMAMIPFGLMYFVFLSRYLGSLRIPVAGYFIAISAMLFFASALFLIEMSLMAKLALMGAILFAVSDGILAYRKFVKPIKYGQFYVMSTYFSAQTFIALSTVYFWY